ncbi:MAG TPA: hypothetical protein VJK90_12510, partial [Acetobacteraceae bacterium]|nr:hypothetical protein [Acetobacteraceae bacterium]
MPGVKSRPSAGARPGDALRSREFVSRFASSPRAPLRAALSAPIAIDALPVDDDVAGLIAGAT